MPSWIERRTLFTFTIACSGNHRERQMSVHFASQDGRHHPGNRSCHHTGLTTIALGDVSSDPESLRFQYPPGVDGVLQHLPTPPAAPTTKRKEKAVYREQVGAIMCTLMVV